MTEKEKAEELVKKFKDYVAFDYRGDEEPLFECQKECALICVNEIISVLIEEISPSVHGFLHEYYKNVKKEIELL